jgi:hypothetical protein
MSEQLKQQLQGSSAMVFGFLLIALGVLFLAGQWFRIDVGHWGWPFFVLIPGLALVAAGLWPRERASERLVVAGAVVTAVGMLLFYQNVTDHWASWAYAWALIAPAAFGVGKMVYGSVKSDHQAVAEGTRIAGIGLVIFLAGLVFFELIIGIGGFGLSAWGWPIVLIVIGAALLVRSLSGGTHQAS